MLAAAAVADQLNIGQCPFVVAFIFSGVVG